MSQCGENKIELPAHKQREETLNKIPVDIARVQTLKPLSSIARRRCRGGVETAGLLERNPLSQSPTRWKERNHPERLSTCSLSFPRLTSAVPSAASFRPTGSHKLLPSSIQFSRHVPPRPHYFINSIRTSFLLTLSDIRTLLTQVSQARCSFEMPNTKTNIPRVLTVAGSDSSGGAGIEADLKVITANGCYGMTAITALTAQNTLGVDRIHHIPGPFLRSCLEAVLSDVGTDVVKTGCHPYSL